MARPGPAAERRPDLPARRALRANRGEDPIREAIMEAMLAASGELGYRDVAVQQVLERYGGHRVQFWERFASREECFELAYVAWMDRLVAEILTTALAEAEWPAQLRAGLIALFEFAAARPELTRALLLEADVAGNGALAKREETIERLGEAIDSVREQVAVAERPPPLTGIFVAGGIATYASETLATGGPADLWPGLPELIRFAVDSYLGEEAAVVEAEAARQAVAARLEDG